MGYLKSCFRISNFALVFIAMALGFSPEVDSKPKNNETINFPNYGYYNYDVLDEAGNKAGSYKFMIRKTNIKQDSSETTLWKIKSRFVNQSILEIIDIVHDGKRVKVSLLENMITDQDGLSIKRKGY